MPTPNFSQSFDSMLANARGAGPAGQLEPSASAACALAEPERLAELSRYQILDTPEEDRFERVVALARLLFDAPGAAISLVDRDRQWFKARSGMGLGPQTPREYSFCSHAMQGQSVFVVLDATKDERFADNPLVKGPPHIRFYAGAPLHSVNGAALGALCILSPEPRAAFSTADRTRLEALADVVANEMELRLEAQTAERAADEENDATSQLREAYFRMKSNMDYATLISEIQAGELSTAKLTALAVAAWEQHLHSNNVLTHSIRSLRQRMNPDDYKKLLATLPGFAM